MELEAEKLHTDTEELDPSSSTMMGMQANPGELPLSFDSWATVLHHPSIISRGNTPSGVRSGSTSTDIRDRRIPISIDFWREFPQCIEAWKAEMFACGLGTSIFAERAGLRTRAAINGYLGERVIRNQETAKFALLDYFEMVNDFNINYKPYLAPQDPPLAADTQVYTSVLAGFRVISNPDVAITDGTVQMGKVGLGEIKAPWVVTGAAIKRFITRLPMSHFGAEFVAPPCPQQSEGEVSINAHHEDLRLGGALVQIYSDLITDKRSVGFLATRDYIIYCFIPPENRTHLSVFYNRVYNRRRLWRPETTPARRFTAQVGLATLAWVAKRFYPMDCDPPYGLKRWAHYQNSNQGRQNENDPTYRPSGPSRSSRTSRPSTHSQYAPISNGLQYCSTSCLKALKDGGFDPSCPNAKDHEALKFDLNSVLEDVLLSVESDEMEVIGGGHSAKCVAVRSSMYGHILVVKVYYKDTEQFLYETELKMYNDLSSFQGEYIPLLLGTAYPIYAGTLCRVLIMSYEGIPLHRCSANDELIENLANAAVTFRKRGVWFEDSRMDNVLVKGTKVTVIDLESAYIADPNPSNIRNFELGIQKLVRKVKKSGNLEALLP